jgi:hypothetical protein
MSACPSCGEQLADQSLKFCDQCGAPLPQPSGLETGDRGLAPSPSPRQVPTPSPQPLTPPSGLVILSSSLAPSEEADTSSTTLLPGDGASEDAPPATSSDHFVPFASRRALRERM